MGDAASSTGSGKKWQVIAVSRLFLKVSGMVKMESSHMLALRRLGLKDSGRFYRILMLTPDLFASGMDSGNRNQNRPRIKQAYFSDCPALTFLSGPVK
jgi:hypothetical protein